MSHLFVPQDKDGYFINVLHKSLIQNEYRPIVNQLVDNYLNTFHHSLHSIYLTGSVAQGNGVPNKSDIDSFAVLKSIEDISNKVRLNLLNKQLLQNYDWITRLDCDLIMITDLHENTKYKFVTKYVSTCLYGIDLGNEIEKMRPSILIANNLNFLKLNIELLKKKILLSDTNQNTEKLCRKIMKCLLRGGFEICIEKEQKYTHDVEQSYLIFTKCYSEVTDSATEAFKLVNSPTGDKEIILDVINRLGNWLIRQ